MRESLHRTIAAATAFASALATTAAPMPVHAEERVIRCESHRFRYEYCRVETDDRVEFLEQHSFADCRQNESWGYDRHGVWVDRGCHGEFRVGRRHGDHHGDALKAGAAIAGIAIIAALAAHRDAPGDTTKPGTTGSAEMPAWAIGSFTGFDPVERADVQLTVRPDGQLNGRAGEHGFSGRLRGNELQAGRYTFRITSMDAGFNAVDVSNPDHRLYFRRSGGGY